MVVDVLEIVVLVAFWAFTIWRFATPQTPRGKAIRLVVLLATLSFTFNRREISYATDTVLHVPDISVPLKNLATVAASAGMVHLVGLLSPDPARWAWLRRGAYALLSVTAAAMCVLFLLVPRRPARYDFVYEHAGEPLVTAYAVLTQLGLTVGLICALVLFRPAGRAVAPRPLRTGMWLLSAAAVVGLLFMANRVVYQISHAAGSTALDGTAAQNVSRALLAMMLLLFAAGGALPALGGLRRWTSRYVALQRLRPLWAQLSAAAPGVVLGDPPGRLGELFALRSVELRLYRRVIEIRDAQWLLAGRAGEGADDAAALRAAVLARRHGSPADARAGSDGGFRVASGPGRAAHFATASPAPASTASSSAADAAAAGRAVSGAAPSAASGATPGTAASGAASGTATPGTAASGTAASGAAAHGASGPPGASQSAGGPDVDAEVRALLGLARRFRDAAVRDVVATPVGLTGHNDPSHPDG
ncbi:MAB_1171c family putative transporter [Dactylosporangium sp. NPDC050688]|uniref:MAB_1171c family putative transporter n=1 Tax=Dactylosporangium sp. NPDC050688 TaxID=3157217 RepID=UPI0033D6D4FD